MLSATTTIAWSLILFIGANAGPGTIVQVPHQSSPHSGHRKTSLPSPFITRQGDMLTQIKMEFSNAL